VCVVCCVLEGSYSPWISSGDLVSIIQGKGGSLALGTLHGHSAAERGFSAVALCRASAAAVSQAHTPLTRPTHNPAS
jgi:hypothetical protein